MAEGQVGRLVATLLALKIKYEELPKVNIT